MIVCETENCPLTYVRLVNGQPAKGLSVTVSVVNARTGQQLLAPTPCPEQNASGIYTLGWVHGLIVETFCVATYTPSNGRPISEDVLIKFSGYPARGA